MQRTWQPCHGGEGNRTPDLLNAIQALSQLSYAPSFHHSHRTRTAHQPPFPNVAVQTCYRRPAGTTKYSQGYTECQLIGDWRNSDRPVSCSASETRLRSG